MSFHRALPLLALLLLTPAIRAGGPGSLSARDIAAIKQVHTNYEQAWLKGDADGVRALFTEDSVLFPPHGDTPRVGRKGLDEFWFPPNAPPSVITKLSLVPQEISGDGQMATAWGHFEVAWNTTQDGKTTSASRKGIFLNVLRKQPDGAWKFSHHMWDDPVDQH